MYFRKPYICSNKLDAHGTCWTVRAWDVLFGLTAFASRSNALHFKEWQNWRGDLGSLLCAHLSKCFVVRHYRVVAIPLCEGAHVVCGIWVDETSWLCVLVDTQASCARDASKCAMLRPLYRGFVSSCVIRTGRQCAVGCDCQVCVSVRATRFSGACRPGPWHLHEVLGSRRHLVETEPLMWRFALFFWRGSTQRCARKRRRGTRARTLCGWFEICWKKA